MLSQYLINEACYILKKDGQDITIDKVRKLLNKNYSFFDIAGKVLLYKKDIKTRDELIGLINSIDYEAWCDKYSFIHHYKKFYHTYKGASCNVAVV